jgi:dTDP-4-dehydrorhamnose reductase
MKILVTGATGLIGSRFLELLPNIFELTAADLPNFDLRSPNCMSGYSADLDAIINFAAYTNVNEAEKQRNDMAGDC